MTLNKIQIDGIKYRAETGQSTNQDCMDLLEHLEGMDEAEVSLSGLSNTEIQIAIDNAVEFSKEICVQSFRGTVERLISRKAKV